MPLSDVIALIISALALIHSCYNAWQTSVIQKQQVDLQRRITQIEESRERARIIQSRQAVLRAELRNVGNQHYRLFIKNIGQATARNVKAVLDEKPILEHPAIPAGVEEVAVIGPGSEISYAMALSYDCHPPFKFSVTWNDDTGEGDWHTVLTL